MSELEILAVTLFNLTALSVATLLMFVVTQATKDLHLRRNDSSALKASRKNSFYSAAAYLMLSMIFQNYWLIHPTVIATGLVVTGFLAGAGWLLAVSMVSMKSRAPPEGHMASSDVRSAGRQLAALFRRRS